MTSIVQTTLDMLGKTARERVTGIKGIITSVSFDLYGCVQVTLHSGLDKDSKPIEQFWWDMKRIEITDHNRVMPAPEFVRMETGKEIGAAEKPSVGY